MQTFRTIVVSFSLLAATAAGFAQSTGGGITGGLLGQRYADFTFGVQDLHGFPDHAIGLGAGLNLPVSPAVDLGLSFSHDWIDSAFDLRSDTLAATATFYASQQGVKPFAGVGLGIQWQRVSGFGVRQTDSEGLWAAVAGVEWPVGPFTLTPTVGYTGSFENSSTGAVHAGIQAHRWFTAKFGGFADVTYADLRGSGGGSWTYSAGLRMRF